MLKGEDKNLKNKTIGFVGLDVQDTILYLSRIFRQMGKTVLMADYSKSQALSYSVPAVPGVDTNSGMVDYRGTFFTSGSLMPDDFAKFDVSMIFFGFEDRDEIKFCTHIIFTTDGERNHVKKLCEMENRQEVYKQLVFRNAGNARALRAMFVEGWGQVGTMVCEEQEYYCNDNGREKKLRACCQYQEIFDFRGISQNYRSYLKDTVRAVFPEEAVGKKFEACFRQAEMGA